MVLIQFFTVHHPFPSNLHLSSLCDLQTVQIGLLFPGFLHPSCYQLVDAMHSHLLQLPIQITHCHCHFNFKAFWTQEQQEEVPDIVLNTLEWSCFAHALKHLPHLRQFTVIVLTGLEMDAKSQYQWQEELYNKVHVACEKAGLLQSKWFLSIRTLLLNRFQL